MYLLAIGFEHGAWRNVPINRCFLCSLEKHSLCKLPQDFPVELTTFKSSGGGEIAVAGEFAYFM